jgi:tetratricopeptide (TPR) repeat protein
VSDISLAHRAANAAVTYWRYLAMTAWPHALIPFYPDEGISAVTMGAAVAGLVGVTVLVVAMRKRVPSLGVGWLWYLGTLVPVIGIVQVGSQAYADRYTYLPVIGILLMAAGAVASRKAERFVVGASLLVVALLGVLTFRQASLWRDNRTLFAATVQRSPGNYVAHNLLGQSLIQAGQTDAAIHEYLIAQNLAPGFKAPYMALAAALDSQRRHADAQRACAAAMKLWPNDPEPVTRMGQSLMAAGDASGAERSFRQAVALDPQAVPALRGLGFVLGTHGRVEEGLAYVRRAEQLAPGDPYVQLMLGKFLFARGAPIDDVVARFDRALKLHPGWPDAAAPRTFALSLRGMTAVELGRRADSLRAAGRTDDASAVSARAAAMGHAR